MPITTGLSTTLHRLLFLASLAWAGVALGAPAGTITTFAGGGVGDHGLATKAPLFVPQGAAADAAGNLYFADSAQNRVRRVDAATGIITTVAGNGDTGVGSAPGTGIGGPATSAPIFSPEDVAMDSSGNLFVAERANHRILRVDAASGILTVVAGTGNQGFSGDGSAAIAANLSNPGAVALDAANNIYIADTGNDRIRKVDAATGTILTIAGNGTAGFSGDGGPATAASLFYPNDIAVDSLGNVYVADLQNERVRRIDHATGVITTVAGNGTAADCTATGLATGAGLSGVRSVALDPGGNLHVTGMHCVRRVDAVTGELSLAAGNGIYGYLGDGGLATAARIGLPNRIAFDGQGNLFLLGDGFYHIRRVDSASGTIGTVAGNGSYSFGGEDGLATEAMLIEAAGVAMSVAGDVFIADGLQVRRVDAVTGNLTTVAGNGAGGFSGDGGPALAAAFTHIADIASDAAGNLFIVDQFNHRIRRVDAATGIVATVAGSSLPAGFSGDGGLATSAALHTPLGVALDAAGNLYVADSQNHRIRKVSAATGVISTVAGSGAKGWLGDGGQAVIASLDTPEDVAVDAAGNLYIADTGNSRIRKVAAGSGVISTIAGNGVRSFAGDGGLAVSASLNWPSDVAVDVAGNLFIADKYNYRVRRVEPVLGLIATVAGSGDTSFPLNRGDGGPAVAANLALPAKLLIDGAGNLFVADSTDHRVRKVRGVSLPFGATRADLGADGKSDLVWQHADGRAAVWLMNGLVTSASSEILPAGTGFSISHIADFNGDGKADLLWRHADGRAAVWLMNGTTPSATAQVLNAGSGWTGTHVADLNGDGRADIVWQHADGTTAAWLMNGTTMLSGATLLPGGTGWAVAKVADFDGDGRADLLWEHGDGRAAIWLMAGLVPKATNQLLNAGSGWTAIQAPDLDGDGNADIVWQHADGSVAVWLMNGASMASGKGILGPGTGWTVAMTGDFNADAKEDLLWSHAGGGVAIWLMNGSTVTATRQILSGGTGWTVRRLGDLNGDKRADIVWQNADGSVAAWLMIGYNVFSGSGILGPASGWSVSGASP